MQVLDFVKYEKELSEKTLLHVYEEKFGLGRFTAERKKLVKRAFELEKIQAFMFAGKIYGSYADVEKHVD